MYILVLLNRGRYLTKTYSQETSSDLTGCDLRKQDHLQSWISSRVATAGPQGISGWELPISRVPKTQKCFKSDQQNMKTTYKVDRQEGSSVLCVTFFFVFSKWWNHCASQSRMQSTFAWLYMVKAFYILHDSTEWKSQQQQNVTFHLCRHFNIAFSQRHQINWISHIVFNL